MGAAATMLLPTSSGSSGSVLAMAARSSCFLLLAARYSARDHCVTSLRGEGVERGVGKQQDDLATIAKMLLQWHSLGVHTWGSRLAQRETGIPPHPTYSKMRP
jgi:hypothetical protein